MVTSVPWQLASSDKVHERPVMAPGSVRRGLYTKDGNGEKRLSARCTPARRVPRSGRSSWASGIPCRAAAPAAAADRVRGLFVGTRAEPVVLSERIGDASALKMAFGSFNKASHALAAVSHALAEEYGVGAALLAEADEAGGALAKIHRLPSVAARAWRWAPEMLEAAESFAAVGLPAELATGAAAVFARWADD